jgi:hypothetical protein
MRRSLRCLVTSSSALAVVAGVVGVARTASAATRQRRWWPKWLRRQLLQLRLRRDLLPGQRRRPPAPGIRARVCLTGTTVISNSDCARDSRARGFDSTKDWAALSMASRELKDCIFRLGASDVSDVRRLGELPVASAAVRRRSQRNSAANSASGPPLEVSGAPGRHMARAGPVLLPAPAWLRSGVAIARTAPKAFAGEGHLLGVTATTRRKAWRAAKLDYHSGGAPL